MGFLSRPLIEGATVRFVDADEIKRVLTFPLLVRAFEVAHQRPKIEIQDGFLGGENGHYFVRHAVDSGRFMASKLITSFPETPGRPACPSRCVRLVHP